MQAAAIHVWLSPQKDLDWLINGVLVHLSASFGTNHDYLIIYLAVTFGGLIKRSLRNPYYEHGKNMRPFVEYDVHYHGNM